MLQADNTIPALIAGRLWYIRFRLRSMPDYAGHSVYNRVCTAVAIFVESVAAYFLLIIPWVVTYAQGQWLAQIFFCAMPQVLVRNLIGSIGIRSVIYLDFDRGSSLHL